MSPGQQRPAQRQDAPPPAPPGPVPAATAVGPRSGGKPAGRGGALRWSFVVSAPSVDVIRRGRERVRTGPWRGDRRVAYLAPVPAAPLPSAEFLQHCLDTLAGRGYRRVVTPALSPLEQVGFLAAGFELEEHLHLLGLDMDDLVDDRSEIPFSYRLRRVRSRRVPEVLAVDAAAFSPFWRLDQGGLDEAIKATPRTRFRVAVTPRINEVGDRTVDRQPLIVGYAICGRAGDRGFVQRLAVVPDWQGRGLGRALLIDGLLWMRSHQVRRAVVNTQHGNESALALYRSMGFRPEPIGLSVLSVSLA
jgi:ribosomal protein S18 acetylase RimI-like enzyme